MKKIIFICALCFMLLADILLLGYFAILIHRKGHNHRAMLVKDFDITKNAEYSLEFTKPFAVDEFVVFIVLPKNVDGEILQKKNKIKITIDGRDYDLAYDSMQCKTTVFPLRTATMKLRVNSHFPPDTAPVECKIVVVYFFSSFSFLLQIVGISLFLSCLLSLCLWLLRP